MSREGCYYKVDRRVDRWAPAGPPDPAGRRTEAGWRDPEAGAGRLRGPGKAPEAEAGPRSGLQGKAQGGLGRDPRQPGR